jgi:hypothetical protein
MSVEASCRKYLDALAKKISDLYDFDTVYQNTPTMGDVLKAKEGTEGQDWTYMKRRGNQLTNIPLPKLFSELQWDRLKALNRSTTLRIHNGILPQTRLGKHFVILSHSDFTTEFVNDLKEIASISNLVFSVDDLVIKDEAALSGSSGSESSSPDKDKAL